MLLIKKASKEKLRGGFYTPIEIAQFILKWGFNGNTKLDVLEPSCGDGVFLEAIKNTSCKYKSITAVELDDVEAKKARKIKPKNTEIIIEDFHQFFNDTKDKFDLIVGNPPYIRYQYFNKEQQKLAAKIFKKANLKYSKLTNAWVSFVVGSSLLLKKKGKIGFVLPAEILQVTYAKTLRQFLSKYYNKINIISFKKLVFPGIQQEVVLLLCEKDGSENHTIEHLELRDAKDLKTLDVKRLKSPRKQLDFAANKWTFYFLDQKEIDFLEHLQKEKIIPKFGEYAKVEVGITTGSNPFFTVPLSVVQFYNLDKYAKPLVGRSVQVPSAIFTKKDWERNRDIEAKTHLLAFPKFKELNGSRGAKDYIAWGEEQKIHEGYKCRIREEWQIVPSLRISEALFIRRNNLYPKLIINKANAYTTDTMHRVSILGNANIKALTASYYNSLSFAYAEICGRSHGGGVLELMPNEVEEILIPYHFQNKDLLNEIDSMIRKGKDIFSVLAITNDEILRKQFNFSKSEILLTESIWKKLSNRRLQRGKN